MPVLSESPHEKDVLAGSSRLAELYPFKDASVASNEWKVTSFEKTPPVRHFLSVIDTVLQPHVIDLDVKLSCRFCKWTL